MRNIIIRSSFFLVLAGASFSCSKKIDEAYANPNANVRVPVETLLPQIVSAMAGNYAGHGTMWDSRYIGAYIQNWQWYTNNSNFDRMGYTNSAGDVAQSTWRMHYYDIGQNNARMIQWALEEGKPEYAGAGKAIFAWSWLTLTDYYGEVILKEAFNTDLITFKYDTQEEVYEHVRKLCYEALAHFDAAGTGVNASLAKGDTYFYGGDIGKWRKFVHGVLARFHNHQSNLPSYNADSVIYHADRSILVNADNAMVKFAATPLSATNNFFGPLRNNLGAGSSVSPTGIRQGAYIANLMNGTNSALAGVEDPRAWYILRGNVNGTIVGVEPNLGQQAIPDVNNRPENFWGVSQVTVNNTAPASDANARFIFKNNSPFPIMTASEIHFMKAEAAFKKGYSGIAYNAYKEGISQHFDMLTTTYNLSIPAGKEITPAVKAAYMADPAVVPPTPAELKLNQIMLQKYIAMFGYGVLETWVDMRRYDYVDLGPDGGQVYTDFELPTGGDLFPDNNGLPVYRMRPRFNSEYVWNILELQRIGATELDYHTKKMWWNQP